MKELCRNIHSSKIGYMHHGQFCPKIFYNFSFTSYVCNETVNFFSRAEYKAVKEDSSHVLHSVYIGCVKDFKEKKELNAAMKKNNERAACSRALRKPSQTDDCDMSMTTSLLLSKISKSKPKKKKNL